MSALGCWSLSRNMWTPITSLETETFYKSITIVMKKCHFFFLKSSTVVMPVIIYIMDYILATCVCWFNISLFHSVICFVSAFVDWQMVFLSLSHLVIISDFSKSASCYVRGRCCQLFCIDVSSEQRQILVSSNAYLASFLKEHIWEADILGRIPLRSDAHVCFRVHSSVNRPLREDTRETILAICYSGCF